VKGHTDDLLFIASVYDSQFVADLPRKYALHGLLFETTVKRRYHMNGILLLMDDYGLFISVELALCEGIDAHFVLVILFSVIETKVKYGFLNTFRIFIREVCFFLFLCQSRHQFSL